MNCPGYLQIQSNGHHFREISTPTQKDVFLSHLELLSSKIRTNSQQIYHREKTNTLKKILKNEYLTIDEAEFKDDIFDYYSILQSKKAARIKAEQEESKSRIEFVTEILEGIIEAALVPKLELYGREVVEEIVIQDGLNDIVESVELIRPPKEPLYLLEDYSAFSRSRWIAAAMQRRAKSIYALKYYNQCLE